MKDNPKRRIYPIKLVVNNRKLDEIAIDPHYEEKASLHER